MTFGVSIRSVRPDGQVRMSGGHPHLTIVEGLSFPFDEGEKRKGFDKLSPNGGAGS